jgi:transketolase
MTAQGLVGRDLENLAVNTIRILAADAVQAANSGHPGLPMGCADFAWVLFTKFLKFDPRSPDWPDRDRFVLSAGHGSMLIYSMLHLTGYDLPMKELERFRQWDSKTPGHPESGHTPGIETTTGPLGQGVANAVGLALAERLLAARYNTAEDTIVDHYTYALVSDGDLMEGISHEAASLAGHLGLGKLIFFYDDNHITIEGETSLAMSDDAAKRFESYGWHVQRIDGQDRSAIEAALKAAKAETTRPSILVARTTIAFGSPNKAGTHDAHGTPLGPEELAKTRAHLGFDYPPFTVPDPVKPLFAAPGRVGAEAHATWKRRFDEYKTRNPEKHAEFVRTFARKLQEGWKSKLPKFPSTEKPIATRAASGKVLSSIADAVPELIGGSADLAPSTNTYLKDRGSVGRGNFAARNLHFGIREHAMGGLMNGLVLHGGIRPYGATFLVFSDYMRPSVRLAALMHQPVIYVFTHDSIFVGEDGPTHQPVEHAAALRTIPNLRVFRPGDANETAAAWALALEHLNGPTALLLTRQNLPIYEETLLGKGVERGGYVIDREKGSKPAVVLIATGSELHIAREARKVLEAKGIDARVVSMPCREIFEEQPKSYRDEVIPPSVTRRVVVEAGVSFGWEGYLGTEGKMVGMDRFGASAPMKILAEEFGFTSDKVAAVAASLVR